LPTVKVWAVTLRTARDRWSTVEVEAVDYIGAVDAARRLLGAYPVTSVE
jgi:hypothetical protein